MDKAINYNIEAVTQGKAHHLFGFHDLVAWNKDNDRMLAIQVEEINVPPDPTLRYPIGYVNNQKQFIQFGETSTFNYPQGARQQWVGETNLVVVNDAREGKVISKLYDTNTCELIDVLDESTHIVTSDGLAFGLDYARLFRLGAYGYNGLIDLTIGNDTPSFSGIVVHDIYTKEKKVLLSVKEVSEYQMNASLGKHHYITHLVLSPDQKRIAFLHRYKLSDGGETTRICTIGIDGSNLKCLATGFLSHFDWMNNEHVFIYGREGSNVEKLRGSILYKLIPTAVLKTGKQLIKKILVKRGDSVKSNFHWLLIPDVEKPEISYVADGIIKEDGHPMFCPANREWMICDNYPDKNGMRTLFLYHHPTCNKIDLGTFKMINLKPDLILSKELLSGIDKDILKIIGLENLAFTRSGLHCDLHPRWSPDGTKVAFDSIHEGSRQIYQIDVTQYIQ